MIEVRPMFAVAFLALAACGSAETNASNTAADSSSNVTANAAAPANRAAASPAPAQPGSVTADYMVGKWSAMGEDCSDVLEFRKDGTVTTPIGPATWTLVDDRLAIDFGDGSKSRPTAIRALGPDRIELTKDSGGKETQKRC